MQLLFCGCGLPENKNRWKVARNQVLRPLFAKHLVSESWCQLYKPILPLQQCMLRFGFGGTTQRSYSGCPKKTGRRPKWGFKSPLSKTYFVSHVDTINISMLCIGYEYNTVDLNCDYFWSSTLQQRIPHKVMHLHAAWKSGSKLAKTKDYEQRERDLSECFS